MGARFFKLFALYLVQTQIANKLDYGKNTLKLQSVKYRRKGVTSLSGNFFLQKLVV